MADGTRKAVKDLQIGDEVLAVPHGDPEAEATACRVTEINRSSAESSWQLIFENENGETLELNVLAGHPVYVEGQGWTDIADLKSGDVCITSDGTPLTLRSKTLSDQPVNVWSITVVGNHTFYVGQETGICILVHNECGICGDSEKNITSTGIFREFLKGSGPQKRIFRDGDIMTDQMKKHWYVRMRISETITSLEQGCPICAEKDLSQEGEYSYGGLRGVARYADDFKHYFVTGDLGPAITGSYSCYTEIKDLDYNKGSAKIKVVLSNDMSLQSGTRPPVIGYWDIWKKNFRVNPTSGPLSTKTQEYIWVEEIQFNPKIKAHNHK